MRTQRDCSVGAVMFAAVTIIGCCLSAMVCSERCRAYQQRTLKDAVQNWEGEGGAVVPEPEEDFA